MTPTKLLVGQMIIVFAIAILGVGASTQWAAKDRYYPSSKTCSCCGSVKAELALSQRLFICDTCSFEAGRDLNAALNLQHLAASSAVTACGEDRAGAGRKPRVKRASMKQESDIKAAA